jgi:hypothetical protein
MTRDVYLTDLTVDNGVTLDTANQRIFSQGTVTNNGTIRVKVNDGQNGADGGADGSASSPLGTACAQLFSDSTAPGSSDWVDPLDGNGGDGGAGADGAGTPGGIPEAATPYPGTIRSSPGSVSMELVNAFSTSTGPFTTTGAASGGQSTGDSGGGFLGGGCGVGGGNLCIVAAGFAGTGSLEAKGGDGGDGDPASTDGTGGGGGGAGGRAVITTQADQIVANAIPGQTIDVSGGTGGTGHGTAGTDGQDGDDGVVILVPN